MALAVAGLFVGKYPLSMQQLLAGDAMQWRVFLTLRCSRTLVGVIGGFALGVSGFVYQTVFGNPLASPDIIGVSSGASAGAAAGILFLSGAAAVAVVLALALSTLNRSGKSSTIVLAGIAVHSLAQTVLMCLKLTADPERELASIEYWMMGSLNGVSVHSIGGNLILCVLCMGGIVFAAPANHPAFCRRGGGKDAGCSSCTASFAGFNGGNPFGIVGGQPDRTD